MPNAIQDAQRLGQSIWYDNVRRGLLTSGEMARLIELGVTGVTSNPTIFEKAIAGSTDYDEALLALDREGKDAIETYEVLAVEDIRWAADLLRAVYDRTGGVDGYACLEVRPALAHDTDGTVEEARRLFAALERPNVLVKVPATSEGIPAIRRLIGEGVNVNVTLIFSLHTYRQVMDAYIAGLEDLARDGGDPSKVASVASFFLSRVDTAVDAILDERIRQGRVELGHLLGKTAIASAKQAYRTFKDTFEGEHFASLRAKGARVQRPLWASTGTKNPSYSEVLYVESLIGPDTVNTVPPATLTAFLEHGTAAGALEGGITEANRTLDSLVAAGISLEQVTDTLLADGVKAFADSFEVLIANIEGKRTRLLAREQEPPIARLGAFLPEVEMAEADLQERDLVGRIWRKDHTVWKQRPTEITDRLGWLTITELMCEQVPVLEAFAREVTDKGVRHVVLLGMGGSSLGSEVLRQTIQPQLRDNTPGGAGEYPELIMLDSTVPASVRRVEETIDPARTLFLVSSKSGSSLEPLCFYAYFRSQVERVLGKRRAGQSFVAITDAGTPLERLAREEGFLRIYLNPPDVGGRYSVLSYFGMVPAALMGVDIKKLVDRADCMKEGCASCVPIRDNPGAYLGTIIGSLAGQGRDKLTLVTSPALASFGLWVEQMVAESVGKEGKGIIPVAGEPLMTPDYYGDDRLFLYLRLDGDDNISTDAAMERIASSGQPLVRLELRDRYDVGAEFFRWEFATAVAGATLGIHPFDQPDVKGAKDMTDVVLQEYKRSGRLPDVKVEGSPKELLSQARPGDYLAIMPYLRQTKEMDDALAEMRRKVMARHRIATTAGYGPRYLHSTGQLHKGGPSTGLYIQMTADHEADVPIPGQTYTFGVLADAQALGDLRVLKSLGRRVVRVHLGPDNAGDIRKLAEELV